MLKIEDFRLKSMNTEYYPVFDTDKAC